MWLASYCNSCRYHVLQRLMRSTDPGGTSSAEGPAAGVEGLVWCPIILSSPVEGSQNQMNCFCQAHWDWQKVQHWHKCMLQRCISFLVSNTVSESLRKNPLCRELWWLRQVEYTSWHAPGFKTTVKHNKNNPLLLCCLRPVLGWMPDPRPLSVPLNRPALGKTSCWIVFTSHLHLLLILWKKCSLLPHPD